MKTISKIVSVFVIAMTISSCSAQDKKENIGNLPIMNKEASLDMNKDSLDAKIVDALVQQVVDKKLELTDEALSTIGETYAILDAIKSDNKEDAIKKGNILIGKLEVLLTRDPDLSLIPVDVNYRKEEIITTIDEVRNETKLAKKAMDDGYYQLAGDILNDLKSEMIIDTYFLPAGTYPEAIKIALALLEEDKPKEAEAELNNVLKAIVIEETVQPLPILNAEQMIIEASFIDKENHDNIDKVINLLKNADYQLTLAEEMGYGKKDKDFKTLSESIKDLKKSVSNKKNSESAFDSLIKDLTKFKTKIFS